MGQASDNLPRYSTLIAAAILEAVRDSSSLAFFKDVPAYLSRVDS